MSLHHDKMIAYHTLQAHWWMAAARTGVCTSRVLQKYDGNTWIGMTDEESINEAMDTAARHIELVHDVYEAMENDIANETE